MYPHSVLLSVTYLGPVQYFTKFLLYDEIWLEIHEHYSKQTYRNRCNIYGANGKLPLTVPVLKGDMHRTLITDLRIDNNKNWQKLHWKGIESAYRSSPFFEFYIDEFSPFYSKKYVLLFDFNMEILLKIMHLLDLKPAIKYTDKYRLTVNSNVTDMRDSIHPKQSHRSDQDFSPVQYNQVFSDRHGFITNLSILDLIFNTGPEVVGILRRSSKSLEGLEPSRGQGIIVKT
jgi:hypothetical protein